MPDILNWLPLFPLNAVLIRSGKEVSAAAEPEDVGCLAHIMAGDAEQLRLLMLRPQGGQRCFRIIESRMHEDQNLGMRIELVPPNAPSVVTQQHEACAATRGTDHRGSAQQGAHENAVTISTIRFRSICN